MKLTLNFLFIAVAIKTYFKYHLISINDNHLIRFSEKVANSNASVIQTADLCMIWWCTHLWYTIQH